MLDQASLSYLGNGFYAMEGRLILATLANLFPTIHNGGDYSRVPLDPLNPYVLSVKHREMTGTFTS